MTAAGWLLNQESVDLGSIEWVEGAVEYPVTHGKPTVLPPLKPVKVQGAQPAGPLDLASVTAFKSGGCPYASHLPGSVTLLACDFTGK